MYNMLSFSINIYSVELGLFWKRDFILLLLYLLVSQKYISSWSRFLLESFFKNRNM